MTVSKHEKIQDLLDDFSAAMLVTRTADGKLRSRPMQVADVEPDGVIWFMTERHSGKMEELSADSHVNVAMQNDRKFVSISGTATAVDDRRKVEEVWNEAWKTWFPGGKDDPGLVLLKVQGDAGEYWDNSGVSGIKYLIEAGRAYLNGEKPDVAGDPKIHGKVKL
jgi:general stress protein 26